ncbi:zinc finger, CCHC-type containing protein, partial [Tanacetum coccineum]
YTTSSLADSGAIINLLPHSIYKQLGLEALTPTRMTLELANRSITHPMGIAEDVVVKVDGFTFLADFVVVNFEPDPRVPIILGRPFLRTAKAHIDLYEETLTLRVGKEELVYYADKFEKNKHFVHAIFVIDFSRDDPFSGSTTTHFDDPSPSSSPVKTSDNFVKFADKTTNQFSMKDMGVADVILGIRIKHESNGIAISQSHYIEKVLKKFNYFDCTLVSTPMDTSEKLMPNNVQAVSQLEYSRVIGCLMYAMTCTRLDIAFVVGKLSRYTSNPEGYTDASWISNTEDNSSTSGWVFLLGGGAIS